MLISRVGYWDRMILDVQIANTFKSHFMTITRPACSSLEVHRRHAAPMILQLLLLGTPVHRCIAPHLISRGADGQGRGQAASVGVAGL